MGWSEDVLTVLKEAQKECVNAALNYHFMHILLANASEIATCKVNLQEEKILGG